MIGKVYTAIFPFFDINSFERKYKKRPVLIISDMLNNDYTILPVSTISNKSNIDPNFDIEIDPKKYPKLNLNKHCYIRTHKQAILFKQSLHLEISDLKKEYIDLYNEIIEKLNKHQNYILKELKKR